MCVHSDHKEKMTAGITRKRGAIWWRPGEACVGVCVGGCGWVCVVVTDTKPNNTDFISDHLLYKNVNRILSVPVIEIYEKLQEKSLRNNTFIIELHLTQLACVCVCV